MVEKLTLNQYDEGSIPSASTNFLKIILDNIFDIVYNDYIIMLP